MLFLATYETAIENLDAAIIGTTAVSRHRTHLVLVVPNFCAGLGVEGVNMTERRRDIHDAVQDNGRSLKRFLDVGLENPRDVQVLHIVTVDVPRGVKARLGVIGVGQ